MVDLYQMMASILGIEGHSHNGSWDRVKDYLISCGDTYQLATVLMAFSICLSLL